MTDPETSTTDPTADDQPALFDAEPVELDSPPEPPAAGEEPVPNDSETRSARRQRADGEKYRGQLRIVEAERDQLQQKVRDLQRAEIARTTGVPVSDITGDDLEAMTAAAATFTERIQAELQRRGISPAAPSSMVTFGAERPSPDASSEFVKAFTPPNRR